MSWHPAELQRAVHEASAQACDHKQSYVHDDRAVLIRRRFSSDLPCLQAPDAFPRDRAAGEDTGPEKTAQQLLFAHFVGIKEQVRPKGALTTPQALRVPCQ